MQRTDSLSALRKIETEIVWPKEIKILDQVSRDALKDADLLNYLKSGILYQIDFYLQQKKLKHVNHGLSFNQINSWRATYTGDTGRRRAEDYRCHIDGMTNVDSLLASVLEDLNNASAENEMKTLVNFPGQAYAALRCGLFGRKAGPGHWLGNSHHLACLIANQLYLMFYIVSTPESIFFDMDTRRNLNKSFTQEGWVNSELKALIRSLELVLMPMMEKRRAMPSEGLGLLQNQEQVQVESQVRLGLTVDAETDALVTLLSELHANGDEEYMSPRP